MKITMTITPSYDNEIHFFDACKAAADKLMELGKKSLEDGDCDQFKSTIHDIFEDNDDAELIGHIRVSR